jgi:nitroreductase
MDLYDVMTTTFASRDFTDEPLPDDTLFKILDRARFAPSGGSRQPWKVIVVRDTKTREGLSRAAEPAAKRYVAQERVGEVPWNTIQRSQVDAATIERTAAPLSATEPVLKAAVVLVVAVDLKLVASMDADLDRVGIVSGASVYPFVWNILLAGRHEGFAGALTTLAAAQEPAVQALLGLPPHMALAAVIPLGRPVKTLTRLKRKAVEEFAMLEKWGGLPLRSSRGLAPDVVVHRSESVQR